MFTYDMSLATNAPVFTLFGPRDGDKVSGTEFTLRGHLSDPTASIQAQVVTESRQTNVAGGLVERNGLVWIENLQLRPGTNIVKVITKDAAGHATSTDLTVRFVESVLTIDNIPPYTITGHSTTNVSGNISLSNFTVWVNGVKATQDKGRWYASPVPVGPGGTAVIQARAIPNSGQSERRGSLSPGGKPAQSPSDDTPSNPEAEDSITAEIQRDKAPYVE
jgi:hypothetical protein